MLNSNPSNRRFAYAIASGLVVSILIMVAALVQASASVQSYL